MQKKVTQAVVDQSDFAEDGQMFIRDTELKGFCLRIGKTKKSYVVEARVRGKTRRVVIGDVQHMSVSEARKRAKIELAAMAEGRDTNAEKALERAKAETLREAFNRMLEARSSKHSPKTVYDYRKNADRFFSDWLDGPLRSISPNMFLERFDRITAENGKASATSATRLLSSIWTFARETSRDANGYYTLPETPTSIIRGTLKQHKLVRRTRYVKRERDFFDAINQVANKQFRLFMEMALRTGARRSELSHLRWQNVDFDDSSLLFPETKNGRDHRLPMSRQITALLTEQRENTGHQEYIWGDKPYGDPRKSLNKMCEHYGELLSAHDLRRSFKNLLDDAEVTDATIKVLMNHRSADVTDGYASRDIGPRHFKAMQAVSDLIDERVKSPQE